MYAYGNNNQVLLSPDTYPQGFNHESDELKDQKTRLQHLENEFVLRVHYDFRRYLFLGLKRSKAMSLSHVIDSATSLPGYEKHKNVIYHADDGDKICHLYIKYSTAYEAVGARNIFRGREEFNAELVDDILKGWYSYELYGERRRETIGVLDYVGEVTYNRPLTEEIARNLLMQFGDPRIQVSDNCVKVAFSSMAEGIAACIVYGQWYFKSAPQDPKFHYRILLEKSDHFMTLINKCNQSVETDEALRLDYFIPNSEFNYKNARNGKEYLHVGNQRGGRQFSRGRGGYKPRDRNFKQRYNYQNQKYVVNVNQPPPNVSYYYPSGSNEINFPLEASEEQYLPGNLQNVDSC